MRYTAPESERSQPLHTSETLAFAATWEAMQMIGPVDHFYLRLVTEGITDEAQTIYLRELANW